MPSMKHPFDPESLYQFDDEGNIRVSNGNQCGVFTREGRHLSGDIRQADPQLCVWVGNNPGQENQLRSTATNGGGVELRLVENVHHQHYASISPAIAKANHS